MLLSVSPPLIFLRVPSLKLYTDNPSQVPTVSSSKKQHRHQQMSMKESKLTWNKMDHAPVWAFSENTWECERSSLTS